MRDDETAAVLGVERGALVITGEPGFGKSTLLSVAASRSSRPVLRCCGVPSEANLPFAGLHQLLSPLSVSSLPPRLRTALLGAFGVEDSSPDRLLVGLAVLSLLSSVSPVLVVVDDVQWLDRESRDALVFAGRRIQDEPVALLMGSREAVPGLPALRLAPLDAHSANRLLDQQPRPPRGQHRMRVLTQAAGNPLALIELSRVDAGDEPFVPLTERLSALFAAELEALPSETRHALLLAAASETPSAGRSPLRPAENVRPFWQSEKRGSPSTGDPSQAFAGPGIVGPTRQNEKQGSPGTGDAAEAFAGPRNVGPTSQDEKQGSPGTGDPSQAFPEPGNVGSTSQDEKQGSPSTGDLVQALDTQAWRAEDLAPAERAGLVRIADGRVVFRHPLVRAAAYHSAPLATRRRAHRELARHTTGDRRAWHLAAAADGRDEDVAAELETTADQAWRRGGYAAAATALERAAELSPAPYDAARRLVRAADVAVLTGQAHWVNQLAAKVDGLTTDRTLRARAALRRGQARALTTGHTEALDLLREAAREPEIAHEARTIAAATAFYAGDPTGIDHQDDPWIRAVLNPYEYELKEVLPELEQQARDDGELTAVGAMAWLLDETREAVRIFDDVLHRWRASGRLPTRLGCSAGWAYLDHGRWAQARLAAEGAKQLAAEASLDHLGAAAKVLDASVDALTGNIGKARQEVTKALGEIDPWRSRAIGVRARWVLGMAAVAKGDHEAAWEQFRLQFTADGEPVHYFWSYRSLGELGAAAARVGKHDEAGEIVDRARKQVDTSPRLHALIHRALALLSTEEGHFHHAVDGTEQWPFDRAQALLDFGEWLRRERRIVEARPLLTEARNLFHALGSEPWLHRAQAELRAAGAEPEPVTPHALTTLSPQQQQIVRLAAQGLSNRDIAERMFLSPKTVASHLYRSYPKLGVTGRAQLRDLLDR